MAAERIDDLLEDFAAIEEFLDRVDLVLARVLNLDGVAGRGGRIESHAFPAEADEDLGLGSKQRRRERGVS